MDTQLLTAGVSAAARPTIRRRAAGAGNAPAASGRELAANRQTNRERGCGARTFGVRSAPRMNVAAPTHIGNATCPEFP